MGSFVSVVEGWFGVCAREEGGMEVRGVVGGPGVGEVVLLTGGSGGGKSTLMREMKREAIAAGRGVVDFEEITLGEGAVIDSLGVGLEETFSLLAVVGLAEAWVYVRDVGKLSEGQKWRLRLARAVVETGRLAAQRAAAKRGGVVLFVDEFAAVLDRVTAMGVANSLRRLIKSGRYGVGVVVATSHSDLLGVLRAEVVVRCDFGVYEVTRGEEIAKDAKGDAKLREEEGRDRRDRKGAKEQRRNN